MKVLVGQSGASESAKAVDEVTAEFKTPRLIIFYAPVSLFQEVSALLHAKFSSAVVIGTTTFYTYTQIGVTYNNVSAVSFEDDIVCSGGVIEEIKRYPMKYQPRIREASESVPHDNTICLEYTTALSMCEELVLATLNTVCNEIDVPVIGGSAGLSGEDFAANGVSYVSYNGKTYTNASAFVMIHNEHGRINLYKENIYKPTSALFSVTSADVKDRIVRELDGQPILRVLAGALRCSPSEVSVQLSIYPLARVAGGELLISDYNKMYDDGSISWNTRIYNNTRVCLVTPGDYRLMTKETISHIHQEIPNPSFTLMFHCLARTLFYERSGFLERFSEEWAKGFVPMLGFTSTGEQLYNVHLNQTLTAAVFE